MTIDKLLTVFSTSNINNQNILTKVVLSFRLLYNQMILAEFDNKIRM